MIRYPSHEVRGVSPEVGRESILWERFVTKVGFELGVKGWYSYGWWKLWVSRGEDA